jgi:uncharacterized protein (DUF4415 family)
MPKSKPLSDARGEVRELTAKDLREFAPARKALPASLRRKVDARGPQRAAAKERVTIQLSHHVVRSFRATGEGWQKRVDAALKDWLKKHGPVS